MIWKLLYYNNADAWNEANLTQSQKAGLIYGGQPNMTDYRVFMDVGADNSWTEECALLRITPIELVPSNYVIGNVTMAFEVFSHYKTNHLSNYQTRLNMISQQILEVFNGAEISGVGRLYFDASASARCKMKVIGEIPYKGNGIIMCNWTL
jgi:hypothetical protein